MGKVLQKLKKLELVQLFWWGKDWEGWSLGLTLCHDGLTVDLLPLTIILSLHWALHRPQKEGE